MDHALLKNPAADSSCTIAEQEAMRKNKEAKAARNKAFDGILEKC